MTSHPLVNRRTGIVTRVHSLPVPGHLPGALRLVESDLADTTRWSPWRSDPTAMGAALWSTEAATGAAIGEAAERYCGNLVPPDLPVAIPAELAERGLRAIPPSELTLYSPAQYASPGFPFGEFLPSTPARWVTGRDLVDGEPVRVPAATVWTNYFESGPARDEVRTNGPVYAGIAAGRDRVEAQWSAVCELIERDAMSLVWTGNGTGVRWEPPALLERLARGPTDELRTTFVGFPTEFGVPAVGALMRDRTRGYLTLGTAWRPDVREAMAKSVAEAAHIQIVMRDLDDPGSAFAPLRDSPASPLKPWREHRDYRSAYRADWHDATDPGCHMQAYLDPALADALETEMRYWPLADLPDAGPPAGRAEQLADTVAAVADRGTRLVAVDITTDDARRSGLHVTRVVGPGLYSNAPAAFPFLGGRRLDAYRDGRPLRLDPLPH